MPYSAIPSRAMPYHLDGSVLKIINASTGVIKSFTSGELAEANDIDYTLISWGQGNNYCVVFFPELRDLIAIFGVMSYLYQNTIHTPVAIAALQGSADSTNGLDGTWTNAIMPNGYPAASIDLDAWRKNIKAVTELTGVKVIRFIIGTSPTTFDGVYALHLYGHKTTGQTADDILFLDAENSDAEYSIDQDFGDRPAGTSIQHQIKIKNSSATLTASTVTLTVTDPDDMIRISDNSTGPWVTSKVIASLAPNTKSAVIYIKCETPAPPTPLGPKRAPISVTVGSWA